MCAQSVTKQKPLYKVIAKSHFTGFKERCKSEKILLATIKGCSVKRGSERKRKMLNVKTRS